MLVGSAISASSSLRSGEFDPALPHFNVRPRKLLSKMKSEVTLRQVEEEDLAVFFEQQLDPEATEMAAFPSRERDAFMAHWQKSMKDQSNLFKTIIFQGKVAGNVVSWEQDDERRVGYWLGKEYWNRGIASSALSQFLKHVRVRPLFALVAERNPASMRVLEKCGFTIAEEGTFSVADGKEEKEYVMRLGA